MKKMAHHDCWHCGGSISSYPNCCQETQDDYIEGQKRKWAEDNAKRQLKEKHEQEIKDLAKNWLEGGTYEDDELYFDFYLAKVKPIRGAKLR
jgi:hypothetical protein